MEGPSVGALGRLGLGAGGLTGDGNDLRLISMVEVLPLLVAEAGEEPYVQSEIGGPPVTDAVPAGAPGSDWWRMYWWFVVLVPASAAAGIWLGVASGSASWERGPADPAGTPRREDGMDYLIDLASGPALRRGRDRADGARLP